MKIIKYFGEIWLDVVGYVGLYKVSSAGRVKSLKFGKERILKPAPNGSGYLLVNLYKDGKMKTMKVHRLVATAFIPNPDNLPFINHKDENKANNRVENLEWVTASYNINYGTRNERVAKSLTNGKLSKPVLQIDKDSNEVIATYPSAREVERQLGFDKGYISNCCNGKYKQAYGYLWRFAEDTSKVIELPRKRVEAIQLMLNFAS